MARDSVNDPYADSDGPSGPIDIAAVRRDDALIDAIAGDGPVATDSADEYELAMLLTAWRSDIIAAPIPERPDVDQVEAAIASILEQNSDDNRRTRKHLRVLRPVAAVAAAAALVVGGVTAVSYNAAPGDPLWNLKQVVFTQQATSAVARVDTTAVLQDVENLIASGDTGRARERLAEAEVRASDVTDSSERQQLQDWWNRLNAELQSLLDMVPTQAAPTTTTAPAPTSAGSTATTDAPEPSLTLPTLVLPTELPPLPTDLPGFTLPFPIPSLPFQIPGVETSPEPTADPRILREPAPTSSATPTTSKATPTPAK